MAGGCQGQRHRMAEGLDVSTEQNRDRWGCSVVVRACREKGTKRKKAKKKKGNKRGQHPQHHKEAGQKRTSG